MQKVGSQMNRSQMQKKVKQTKLSSIAISDADAVYARVTRHYGNRSFLITIYDRKNNRHLTDVKAKVISKKAPKIEVPSIVNVTLAEDPNPEDPYPEKSWGSKTWEIVVPLDDKTVKQLKKEGRISEVLASAAEISSETVQEVDRLAKAGVKNSLQVIDLGFEFEREEEEKPVVREEEETLKKKSKKTHAISEDGEVDIDAI